MQVLAGFKLGHLSAAVSRLSKISLHGEAKHFSQAFQINMDSLMVITEMIVYSHAYTSVLLLSYMVAKVSRTLGFGTMMYATSPGNSR